MALSDAFRALDHPPFRRFFLGQSVSLVGFWLQSVALSWLVYRTTRSPLMLATVAFAGTIPMLVISPFAGALIDRFDRRLVLLSTQMVQMTQAAVLAVLAFSGHARIEFVVPLALVYGCAWAFDVPARQAMLPVMIGGREDLPNAIALSSLVMNLARFVGPALAGLMLAWTGEGWCFLLNSVTFIPVLLAVRALPRTPAAHPAAALGRQLADGFRWVWAFHPARWLLGHLIVMSLTVPVYQAMVPIFASEIHHGDSRTQGLLVSSAGVGALIGTFLLAARPSVRGLVRVIGASSAIAAIGMVTFARTETLWIACAGLVATGFGIISVASGTNTILQSVVDDGRRGRVVSIYAMCFLGIVPLGTLLTGVLVRHLGAPLTLTLQGLVCLAASLAFAIAYPRIRAGLLPVYRELGIIEPEPSRE